MHEVRPEVHHMTAAHPYLLEPCFVLFCFMLMGQDNDTTASLVLTTTNGAS